MDSPPPTRSETMLVPFALARGDGTIVEANDSFQALAGPIDGRKLADIGVAADDVGRGLRRVRLTKPDGTSAEVLFVVSQSSSAEHGSVLAIVALSDKAPGLGRARTTRVGTISAGQSCSSSANGSGGPHRLVQSCGGTTVS